MAMRLDKLLAHYGIGTRKEVKTYIRKGYVQVNGQIIKKDDFKVDYEKDQILFDGQPINYKPYVYLMLNKPSGYVSATKDNVHPTVVDLIKGYHQYDLFPVGRLDLDTEGLLLLTNDGDFANMIMHPRSHLEKIYEVTIKGLIKGEDLHHLEKGVYLEGKKTMPCKIKVTYKDMEHKTTVLKIKLYEGKNRQVKKMFESVGHPVKRLHRISVGCVNLKGLRPGEYRRLKPQEVKDLKKLVGK